MLALEGRQLGNYDVIKRIRVGGMGAVYEGRQRTAFGRRVAIKVILGNYASDPDMRRRFAREARTVARLHHPHILPLIEFGDEQGLLYLVMPFIEGGTLTSYLRRSLPDLSEVAGIFLQLLDAVEYAHDEGLVHRDIKSSNVLMEMRRSGPPYVYLGDFGLVRVIQRSANEQVGKPIPLDQVPGTPHYMAPEQTWGIVTPLTDIYALGVLLYQMLIGEFPYDDPDEVKVIQMHLQAPIPMPSRHDVSIPPELDYVVATAMAKNAEERFQNVGELREAFLAALEGPVATVQETPQPDENDYEYDYEITALDATEPDSTPELLSDPGPLPMQLHAAAPMPLPRRTHRLSEPLPPQPPVPIQVRQRHAKHQAQARRRRSFTFSVLAATIVPLVLLILLIMPRVLNFSLFPAGFPLFGTAPVATITVTAMSKNLQDTYLLTASPQVKSPDLATRVLPARTIQATATGSNATQTTGTRTTAGAHATGFLLFDNRSGAQVPVPSHMVFTSRSGVQIILRDAIIIPPRQNGQDGVVQAIAFAANTGADGNIQSNDLATACCGRGVQVINRTAFTGGADGHTVHFVTQEDLDRVKNGLESGLQQQISQHIQSSLAPNEASSGAPTYTTRVSEDNPVGTQTDHVQVQVQVTGQASAYDHELARRVASQLLVQQAAQSPGSNYQLQQGTLTVATPQVTQRGDHGVVYLSVSVHGLWVYAITTQQIVRWQQNIKGASSAVALAYLNDQPGVSAVLIHLPFGADHIPSSVDQIQVVLIN